MLQDLLSHKGLIMKVKAIREGFYGGKIRRSGDVFILSQIEVVSESGKTDQKASKEATEAQFSKAWMVKA